MSKKENKFREIPFNLEEAENYTVHNQARRESWQEFNESEKGAETRVKAGKISGEKHKGKFLKDWAKENPEEFLESAARGGHTQGTINKENNLGIFGLTKEERAENARKAVKSYFENTSEKEIKERYKRGGKTNSDTIARKKEEGTYIPPSSYIDEETRKQMAKNQSKTAQCNRVKRLRELYDKIDNNDWMTLDQAHQYVLSYRKASKSTTRRMFYSWPQAKELFETKYVPNPTGNGQEQIMIKKI